MKTKTGTKSARAIGYVRVSTAGQAAEGVSLETQRERIEAWALANGYELTAVHVDAGLSGGRADNRPGLQAALRDACAVRGALVRYSLSRIARSTKDAIGISERLHKAGADLVSLSESIDTTSASGKMVFRMLAVLSEFERDLVSERTTAALAHLRAQGRRISGKTPYGFDLSADGSLAPNASERTTIALMHELRAEGRSLRAIVNELNARAIPTKYGCTWTAATVQRILEAA